MSDPAAPPVLFATASPTDPVQKDGRPAISSKVPNACLEPDACIDQYLWSLYERTPKVDTVKVEERIKVKIKNKGKFPLQVTVGTLDPPFTVTSGGGTFNLAKGKTDKVRVQFTPTSTGATTPQTLSITSDNPQQPPKNKTATGSGS